MTRQDYQEYDYLIGMDEWNIRNMLRIVGKDPEKKIHMLSIYPVFQEPSQTPGILEILM